MIQDNENGKKGNLLVSRTSVRSLVRVCVIAYNFFIKQFFSITDYKRLLWITYMRMLCLIPLHSQMYVPMYVYIYVLCLSRTRCI